MMRRCDACHEFIETNDRSLVDPTYPGFPRVWVCERCDRKPTIPTWLSASVVVLVVLVLSMAIGGACEGPSTTYLYQGGDDDRSTGVSLHDSRVGSGGAGIDATANPDTGADTSRRL